MRSVDLFLLFPPSPFLLLMTSCSYAVFPHCFWIVMRVLGWVCDAPLHTEMWSRRKPVVACVYEFSLLCTYVHKRPCVLIMCSYLCLRHDRLRRKLIPKRCSSVTRKEIKRDSRVMEWDAHADGNVSGWRGPQCSTVL